MRGGEATVRTLRQLSNELTEAMRDRKRPSVKTYLLEVVRPITDDDVPRFLRLALAGAAPRRRRSVTELGDQPGAYEIHVGTLALWLDTTGGRVWQIHSLGDASDLGLLVDRLVARSPELDVPWFPEHVLNDLASSGEFVGFGLNYSRAFFAEDASEVEFADSLSVNVRGSESRAALAQFRRQAVLQRSSALSGVRLRNPLAGPGAMTAGRLTSSLTANGRVSSRGDNFDRHRTVVRHTQRVYLDEAERISREMTVGALDRAGEGLRGPLVIDLFTAVDDLATFAGRLFSGVDPFRIWGLLARRGEDLIVANALDLRTDTAFTAEALKDELRVYLPTGASGAIVLRLLALLQRHHDRRVAIRTN